MPAKYICSLDELIEKRKEHNELIVVKHKGELTQETIDNCWKRFLESQK